MTIKIKCPPEKAQAVALNSNISTDRKSMKF